MRVHKHSLLLWKFLLSLFSSSISFGNSFINLTNQHQTNIMNQQLQREQLMEDINSIVGEYFQSVINECDDMGEISNIQEAQEDLTYILCDAVCKNFPAN